MGSKSKSKTANSSTSFAFNNVDYGEGGGSGGLKNLNLAGNNSTFGDLYITDGGALAQGVSIANQAIAAITNQSDNNNQLVKGFLDNTQANTDRQLKHAESITKANQSFLESAFSATTAAFDGLADQYSDMMNDSAGTYRAITNGLMSFSQEQSAAAAKASEKAMDHVFEAFKAVNTTENARMTEQSQKWLIAATVAVVLVMLFVTMKGGR